VLLNYHIGRFVLGSLCVGKLERLDLSSVRVASFSLQHGHYSNPTGRPVRTCAPDGHLQIETIADAV